VGIYKQTKTDFERKEQRAGITSGRRGKQKHYRVFWPLTPTLSRRQITSTKTNYLEL
jgi:hypothetical protein